jgi:hypothetical protein
MNMGIPIRIQAGSIALDAELHETLTAMAIERVLPIEAEAATWGEEIYFSIPVAQQLDETAKEVVQVGDLGYWPRGKAFCIFFGPTPMSRGDEIRPASAVNIVGRVLGDATRLRSVQDGELVRIDRKP